MPTPAADFPIRDFDVIAQPAMPPPPLPQQTARNLGIGQIGYDPRHNSARGDQR